MAKYDSGGGCPCGLYKECATPSVCQSIYYSGTEPPFTIKVPRGGSSGNYFKVPEIQTLNTLTGGSSGYYQLPSWAKELQDLIECKNMNFAVANIFKAAYRLGEKTGTSKEYDLEKIIWFAQRELERIKRETSTSSTHSSDPVNY